MIQEIILGIKDVIGYYFDRQEQMINRQTDKAMERIPEVMEKVVGTLPKLMKDIEQVIESDTSESN